jgi:uncharacterized phage-like protein YoqJ
METKSITICGPRAFKLFGTDYNKKNYINIVKDIFCFLLNNPEINTVYTGMASGIDLLVGLAVIKFNKEYNNKIKLIAAIPGKDQTKNMTQYEKNIYEKILFKASEVIQIEPHKNATAKILKKRSDTMIDKSDLVLAYWDGKKYKSGTYHTINYAYKKSIPIYIVNPFDLDVKYEYPISWNI